MPGSNRFSGDHSGVQEILSMYGRFAVEIQGTFKVDLEELYANDDTVVTVYHATGDRGGEHIDTRHGLVFTMREGRAVDLLDIASDPVVFDKFWA